ncbi:MAG: phosphoglycerate dehydrogenase, partial [Cyanobacteria bacterium]|nr:phosphoglycerate dehydrogenase [Cyanobacteriota bacterium]
MSAKQSSDKNLPKVLITDSINETAVRILKGVCEVTYEKSLSHERLIEIIGDFDALMIRSASTITQDVLDKASHLKIIGRAGVGIDNVDLPAATQRGVIVVNSPEGNTVAASEHTLGMLFALARHIPDADALMKQGKWNRNALVGVELFGKFLGVIGLGKIGGRVAKACIALGMKVLVYDPFLSSAMAEELGVTRVSLEEIWEKADFLTIHAPKTAETAYLINAKTLALCKKGIRIVNCARGGIIHEQDLADAVKSGHVAGVAIDVFEQEPIGADNPLLTLGTKSVLTPHLGASTEEAQINVAIDVAEQIRDFFEFGYARNAVNIPMLRKEILDPVKYYMPMAEALGSFVRQLALGALQQIEITAKGQVTQHDTSPLTLAVLKGLLSPVREGVNYVNAPLIAEEMGVKVKESSMKSSENYLNLLTVAVTTDQKVYRISGTLIANTIYRIVEVDGYATTIDAVPPNILITPHHDRP